MNGLTKKEIDQIFSVLNAKIRDYRSRKESEYKEEWGNRAHEIYYGDQEYASGLIHAENVIIEKLQEKERKKMKA